MSEPSRGGLLVGGRVVFAANSANFAAKKEFGGPVPRRPESDGARTDEEEEEEDREEEVCAGQIGLDRDGEEQGSPAFDDDGNLPSVEAFEVAPFNYTFLAPVHRPLGFTLASVRPTGCRRTGTSPEAT